ncbi:MAG TPA: hypothetical protein VF584_09965 [Longimicrobium sp.]|jgi:hypothetical protein
MKPLRVYIDTSVVGGCLDLEFRVASMQLFQRFRDGSMVMVTSDLLKTELALAPSPVRALVDDVSLTREYVLVSPEAESLAIRYVEKGVIGGARHADALHVASATVHRVDLLASWDFRDIVNPVRVRGYNAVNASEGYWPLVIKSPEEVVRHG